MAADRPLVVLVRHGETEWNRTRRMQGHEDVALSAAGEEQAKRLAERLAAEEPVRIVSSDLRRARDTADAVAQALSLPVETDARFREQNLGAWQGLTIEEAADADPELATRFQHRDPDVRPPGGETRVELAERAWAALLEHAAPGSAGPLVIVAHGGVIQSIVYRVLGLPIAAPRRFLLPNVGMTTLVSRGGTWFVRTLNDVSHEGRRADDSFPLA
jgi:broad specificity phosphatase PhoE